MDKVIELAREAGFTVAHHAPIVAVDTNNWYRYIERFYTLARADLEAEVKRLEAAQYRPAPCHKFCEANAFKIEIRGLEAENETLRYELDAIKEIKAERDGLAAENAKLLAGVEMPEAAIPHSRLVTKKGIFDALYTAEQLQQYAAAAAVKARVKALEAGFDAGFIASARDWAERDDLLADMDSPAYIRDRAAAIDRLKGGE